MIRPVSSPWVMITPPIIRLLMPHDVVWQSVTSSFWAVYWMSKARAKLVPMKCEVPAWSARPSRIIASIVNVRSAPANRSPGVFSPAITGIAAVSTASAR